MLYFFAVAFSTQFSTVNRPYMLGLAEMKKTLHTVLLTTN